MMILPPVPFKPKYPGQFALFSAFTIGSAKRTDGIFNIRLRFYLILTRTLEAGML